MGHDVETLITFMRAMMVPYMWKLDPVAIPMPFREEVQQTRHLSGKPTNKNSNYWSGRNFCRYFYQITLIYKYRIPPNCSTGCLDQFLRGCFN